MYCPDELLVIFEAKVSTGKLRVVLAPTFVARVSVRELVENPPVIVCVKLDTFLFVVRVTEPPRVTDVADNVGTELLSITSTAKSLLTLLKLLPTVISAEKLIVPPEGTLRLVLL